MTSVRHAEERDWSNKRKQEQPTLEDMLPRVLAKKEAGGRRPRPHERQRGPAKRPIRTPPVRPVHRLDRDTSGLMVFARTVPAERHLGQQFRQHTTQRRYLAIVVGTIKAQTIESHLVRDRGDGRRGSTTLANTGKLAITHVRPLEELAGYTLVECRLETGRTHQIRIHLSERGHPVCGDKVYGRPQGAPETKDQSGAPRLALHATELSFEHPETGERLEFSMPLPPDLKQFLERLRNKSK
jgi:23S rRNA pseudouridine1911/1915/1917 synthase